MNMSVWVDQLIIEYLSARREPTRSVGISQCYESVLPGSYFNTPTSNARVTNDITSTFDLQVGFSLSMTFTSAVQTASLMTMWRNSVAILVIEVIQGQVCFQRRHKFFCVCEIINVSIP